MICRRNDQSGCKECFFEKCKMCVVGTKVDWIKHNEYSGFTYKVNWMHLDWNEEGIFLIFIQHIALSTFFTGIYHFLPFFSLEHILEHTICSLLDLYWKIEIYRPEDLRPSCFSICLIHTLIMEGTHVTHFRTHKKLNFWNIFFANLAWLKNRASSLHWLILGFLYAFLCHICKQCSSLTFYV